MPSVGKEKYPYTAKGRQAAAARSKATGMPMEEHMMPGGMPMAGAKHPPMPKTMPKPPKRAPKPPSRGK